MFAQLKERFKVTDGQILKLLMNQDYREIFDDYELVCIQCERSESDTARYEISHILIEELEEEITAVILKFQTDNTKEGELQIFKND